MMFEAEPQNIRELKTTSRPDVMLRMICAKEEGKVYVGSSDSKIYKLDPMPKVPDFVPLEGHTSYVMGLVDTGQYLVSGSYDKSLIWWDNETHKQVRRIEKAHDRWIRNLAITPDQKQVLSVSDDMVCKIWDAQSGELLRQLDSHVRISEQGFPNVLYAVAVSPCGKLVATVDRIAKIKIWDFETGKEIKEMEAPKCYTWDAKSRIHAIGGIRSVAFSPDSKLLAVGGIGQIGNVDHLAAAGRVELFDVESGKKLHMFEGDDKHKGLVEQILFHPSGKWLMAVGGDHGGWVQFMDIEKKETVKQVKAPMHVHQVAVGPDFRMIYGAGHNKICVWTMVPEEKQEPKSKS
ncbi:MAG: hypothetical protein VX438_13260 [Planctomycetota bacterium]|nr:hypothetical protein [Planctomycetota bacterium]